MLNGKVVLITGVSSGMGRATTFATRGQSSLSSAMYVDD